MAIDFREHINALSPVWLRDGIGQRFMGLFGITWDIVADKARIAVGCTKLYSKDRAYDVLDLIGEERAMPRFPGELDADYEARLHDAWRLWGESGTAGGIADMFARWSSKVAVIRKNGYWNWDNQPSNWSRIWVVLTNHGWTSGPPLGGTWPALGADTTLTIGSTATIDDVRAARNVARLFKEGHAICKHVIIVLDSVAWASATPDGTWNNVASRSNAARYWDG